MIPHTRGVLRGAVVRVQATTPAVAVIYGALTPDVGYLIRRTGSPRMPADQVVVSVTPDDQLNRTLIQHAVGIDASQE